MPFNNRWRIDGYLTTKTPLHIGNGSTTTHPDLNDEDGPIEITAVETDSNGRAYIPGTTIKGNLRSWFEKSGIGSSITDQLFGSKKTDEENAVGGKAEFWNVYAMTSQNMKYSTTYWKPDRLTDITVSVSIDRDTRTAAEKKLFHYEFVPPGVVFKISVSVQDSNDDEVACLLYALQHSFSSNNTIAMGASTGNGWGVLEWSLGDISKIDQNGVKKWIDEGSTAVGLGALMPLSAEERRDLIKKVYSKKIVIPDTRLVVGLKLNFKGLFLVNDPSRVKKDETAAHMPRINHKGKVVLPAKSFRGAFRSQAERIIRTIGGRACNPSVLSERNRPCIISKIEELQETLCLACQVFGGTGWKSSVSFNDFVMCNDKKPVTQEFVAIDRFTGGGAEGLKFSAEAVPEPELEGIIYIDMDRINPCGLGMLTLTFRDLIEGDITFGFGSSKGYGACTAKIIDVTVPSVLPDEWLNFIEQNGIDFESLKSFNSTETRRVFLDACVKEFRTTINKTQEVLHA